ncbi:MULTISPECIES: SH3 domain-containing protein [unclassified Shewanella]|uniref:SH3 domain-containing protein n=1 Tax=unclassified Shewanella TaxID=196818 RepID=UPI00397FAC48
MPLLVGAILIVFQQNYEHITSYLSEAKDVESLKTLVKNGTILTISGNWAVVTTNSLNFRKEAGFSSTILANLKLGEPVEVIDDMGQDWLYVRAMIRRFSS